MARKGLQLGVLMEEGDPNQSANLKIYIVYIVLAIVLVLDIQYIDVHSFGLLTIPCQLQ